MKKEGNCEKDNQEEEEGWARPNSLCLLEGTETSSTFYALNEYLRAVGVELNSKVLDGIFAQNCAGIFGILTSSIPEISKLISFQQFYELCSKRKARIFAAVAESANHVAPMSVGLKVSLEVLEDLYFESSWSSEIENIFVEGYSEIFSQLNNITGVECMEFEVNHSSGGFKIYIKDMGEDLEISLDKL